MTLLKIHITKMSLNKICQTLPFCKHLGTYPFDLRQPITKDKSFTSRIKLQMAILFPNFTKSHTTGRREKPLRNGHRQKTPKQLQNTASSRGLKFPLLTQQHLPNMNLHQNWTPAQQEKSFKEGTLKEWTSPLAEYYTFHLPVD